MANATRHLRLIAKGSLDSSMTDWETPRNYYITIYRDTDQPDEEPEICVAIEGHNNIHGYFDQPYRTDPKLRYKLPFRDRYCSFCDGSPKKAHRISICSTIERAPIGDEVTLGKFSMVSNVCQDCAEHFAHVRDRLLEKHSEDLLSYTI